MRRSSNRSATPDAAWMAATQSQVGVNSADLDAVLDDYRRFTSDEARWAYADRWIRLAAPRLDETWTMVYALLREMRERELYRRPGQNARAEPYESFAEYFADTVKRPFATWLELEEAHRFVEDYAPELINESLERVTTVRRLRANGGDRRSAAFQRDNNTLKRGDHPAYIVARLRRDERTGLADAVERGELSARAAALTAGYRKPHVTIRTDDVAAAVRTLLKHFSAAAIRDALDRERRGSQSPREYQADAPGLDAEIDAD